MPLSDADAKARLLAWPTNTKAWTRSGESIYWLRAQPKSTMTVGPRLRTPGAGAFRVQPDGMWVSLGIERGDDESVASFADCVVVESCGTPQNLNDKRSRYAARLSALMIDLPAAWLDEEVSVQAGARRARRVLLGGNLAPDAVVLPVRQLRVLYALPTDDGRPSLYDRISRELALEAHEFVCPQSQLGQYHNQRMQIFLKRMTPSLTRFP